MGVMSELSPILILKLATPTYEYITSLDQGLSPAVLHSFELALSSENESINIFIVKNSGVKCSGYKWVLDKMSGILIYCCHDLITSA